MYAYRGGDGAVLDEISSLDPNHKRSIFKKLAILNGLPDLKMVLGSKWLEGPCYQMQNICIYAVRVHAQHHTQYRIPFLSFHGSYLLLELGYRDNLDFKKLTASAVQRFARIENQTAQYDYFEPISTRADISYR